MSLCYGWNPDTKCGRDEARAVVAMRLASYKKRTAVAERTLWCNGRERHHELASFWEMRSRREENEGSVHLCGVNRGRGWRKRGQKNTENSPAPSSGTPDIS